MAEKSKQGFDPDATVAQPLKVADPEATVSLPAAAIDPEATISLPAAADPEATVNGPFTKPTVDPEATDRRPAFDPEATFNPADRATLDPEATVRVQRPVRKRVNPFAPKSPPETIQANLAALGGLNPLVTMANPILAAVPQIRRSLKHPDAAGLLASLRDQIEALEMTAISAEISDDTISAAVYALCALLDESAAATPWGAGWIENGLLMSMRGEANGGEGFFTQLGEISADPAKNADLLEFFYICIALGFEGRYRGLDGGKQALNQVRDQLYATIARRRPRPDALSEHWRTPTAQAVADAALQTAARANAARAAAEAAARDAEATIPPRVGSRFALSRLPRRVIWSAVAGIVGASIVLYMLALRLLDEQDRSAMTPKAGLRAKADAGSPVAPAAPAADPAAESIAKALAGQPVTVAPVAGGVALTLQDNVQFLPGSIQPGLQTRALLTRIAEVLEKQPGAITVIGHADTSPAGAHYASNADLSVARARTAARLMATKLKNPKRLSAEGRGDSEPVAGNDTEAGRAKNRRIAILLKTAS
jgi:type VI secretion system protein ImpK